jgi:hypothetical protein
MLTFHSILVFDRTALQSETKMKDCQTAKLMSQYAEERMNLDLATCDTFERTVIHPLVTSVERLALNRESSTNRLLEIPALERRTGSLDAQMTRHINVTMSDAKIDMLDRIQNDLQRNLKSEFATENNTFNKIEGGIVQRFESVAGTINRNLHSEGASRYVQTDFFFAFLSRIEAITYQIIISNIISVCSFQPVLDRSAATQN